MEDVDLLGKDTAATRQRVRNMEFRKGDCSQLVSTRCFVERIMKYELRGVGRSDLHSLKDERVFVLLGFVFSGPLEAFELDEYGIQKVCEQGD